MEILGEYLLWPRSDLGSGFRPGWGSFHKLPGPSRGPRSKGLAPLPSVSGPFGGLIRRCSFTHPPRRGCYVGGRGPLLTPTRGGATRHPPSGARYVGTRDPPPPPAPAGGRIIRVKGVSPTHSSARRPLALVIASGHVPVVQGRPARRSPHFVDTATPANGWPGGHSSNPPPSALYRPPRCGSLQPCGRKAFHSSDSCGVSGCSPSRPACAALPSVRHAHSDNWPWGWLRPPSPASERSGPDRHVGVSELLSKTEADR